MCHCVIIHCGALYRLSNYRRKQTLLVFCVIITMWLSYSLTSIYISSLVKTLCQHRTISLVETVILVVCAEGPMDL